MFCLQMPPVFFDSMKIFMFESIKIGEESIKLMARTSDYQCHCGYHSITSVTICFYVFTSILPVLQFNNFTNDFGKIWWFYATYFDW